MAIILMIIILILTIIIIVIIIDYNLLKNRQNLRIFLKNGQNFCYVLYLNFSVKVLNVLYFFFCNIFQLKIRSVKFAK